MYDELVKRLRSQCQGFGKECADCNADGNCRTQMENEAADAIEELNKALDAVNDAHNEGYDVGYWAGRRDYEPKWIPVTERLPEEKINVLILADTIAGKMAKVSFLYKDDEGRNCWTGLDVYGLNLCDWQPTHWMPLPTPPKEEGK